MTKRSEECWVPKWRAVLDGTVPYPLNHHDRIEAERQMLEMCYLCKEKCEKKEV